MVLVARGFSGQAVSAGSPDHRGAGPEGPGGSVAPEALGCAGGLLSLLRVRGAVLRYSLQ